MGVCVCVCAFYVPFPFSFFYFSSFTNDNNYQAKTDEFNYYHKYMRTNTTL